MIRKIKDGDCFSLLTVVEFHGIVKGRKAYKCLCSCGKESIVQGKSLRSGKTQSCGCLRSMVGLAHIAFPYKEYIGKKFDRLKVLEYDYSRAGNGSFLLCQCDCGNQKVVSASKLQQKYVKSCGCLLSEVQKNFNKKEIDGVKR